MTHEQTPQEYYDQDFSYDEKEYAFHDVNEYVHDETVDAEGAVDENRDDEQHSYESVEYAKLDDLLARTYSSSGALAALDLLGRPKDPTNKQAVDKAEIARAERLESAIEQNAENVARLLIKNPGYANAILVKTAEYHDSLGPAAKLRSAAKARQLNATTSVAQSRHEADLTSHIPVEDKRPVLTKPVEVKKPDITTATPDQIKEYQDYLAKLDRYNKDSKHYDSFWNRLPDKQALRPIREINRSSYKQKRLDEKLADHKVELNAKSQLPLSAADAVLNRDIYDRRFNSTNQAVLENEYRYNLLDQSLKRAYELIEDPQKMAEIMGRDSKEPIQETYDAGMEHVTDVFMEEYLNDGSYHPEDQERTKEQLAKLKAYLPVINTSLDIMRQNAEPTIDLSDKIENLSKLHADTVGKLFKLRYRHELMRIGSAGLLAEPGTYNANVSTSINSQLEGDGGIQVFHDNRSETLYPDGSYAITNEHGRTGYRINPDGSAWQPPAEANGDDELDEAELKGLDLQQLQERQIASMKAWFEEQTEGNANIAYDYITELAERYESQSGPATQDATIKMRVLEYWSDYLYVSNNPDEEARITRDSSIEENNELNGVTEYRTSRPDGSTYVRNQNADSTWTVTRRYNRAGVEITGDQNDETRVARNSMIKRREDERRAEELRQMEAVAAEHARDVQDTQEYIKRQAAEKKKSPRRPR